MRPTAFLFAALLCLAGCDAVAPEAIPPEVVQPSPSAPDAPAVVEVTSPGDTTFTSFFVAGEPEVSHSYSISGGWYEVPSGDPDVPNERIDCEELVEHVMAFAVEQNEQRIGFSIAGESLDDIQEGVYRVGTRSPVGYPGGCQNNLDVFQASYRLAGDIRFSYRTPISISPVDTTDYGTLTIERDADGDLIATMQARLLFKRSFGAEQPGDASRAPYVINSVFKIDETIQVVENGGPPLDARDQGTSEGLAL